MLLLTFLLKKTVHTLLVLVGVSVLTFALGRLAPGDPVETLLSGTRSPTAEEREQARAYLGLDSSIPVQYGRWVARVVRGDFGVSYKSGRNVMEEIALRLPATIQLAAGAGAVMLVFAFPLGIISSLYRNRLPDYMIRAVNIVVISIPSFCIGILLILVLGVRCKILPVMGRGSPASLIMPSLSLGLSMGAGLARLIRNQMLETMEKDHVYAARAFGVKKSRIILHDVIYPSLPPVVTSVGLSLGGLLGGSAIIETLFSWAGAGSYMIEAVYGRDYPVIQAYALMMAAIYIGINSAVDFFNSLISPASESGGAKNGY